MAEAVVGSLVYQFKADIADLKNGFANIQTELTKVKSGLGSVNDNFKKVGQDAASHIGLARHEMVNLSRQISDVGVSLASGQSPFMVLIQQGAQIADIFSSSKAGAGAALKGFITQIASLRNVAIASAAGVGVLGAAAYSTLASMEKLSDTAKALGTNRQALSEFNRQGNLLGIDPKTMNEDLLAFAQSLRQAQVAGGDLAEKLAKIGINIKSFDLSKPGEFARLFEMIAEKVRNGSSELDKLNTIKFLGLSNEFMRLFNEGGAAMDDFVRRSQGAAEDSTKPIEEKWRELKTVASDIWKSITESVIDMLYTIYQEAQKVANYLGNAFAQAGVQIEKVAEKAKYAWGYAKSLVGMGSPDTAGYNSKMSDLNNQSEYLSKYGNAKPTELPKINIPSGGVDLSGFSNNAKSKSGAGSKSNPLQSYIDSLKEAAAVAKADADNWALGNVEKARAEALAKAEAIALREGKTLTDAQRDTIRQYASGAAEAKLHVDNLKQAQQGLNQMMSQFADFAIQAFDGLIDRGKRVGDILRDLVKMLANNALKGALTGEGMFGQLMGVSGKNGNTGGLLGMLAGGLSGGGGFGGIGKLFSGFFADGGSIPAGKFGIVGERGPEMVAGPATVTPNAGSPNIQINNYTSADVEARQMSDGQIMVMIRNAIDANNRRVPGIVADAQRRAM